jgi:hypothetical protein
VEGGKDAKCFAKFVDSRACRVIPAHGKDNVIEAVAILTADRIHGVLGVIDTDFWALEETLISAPHLLQTDSHDLETMLLESSAADHFVNELGSHEKIAAVCQANDGDFRPFLFRSVTDLAYLRWASLQHNHALTFDDLPFSDFLDRATLMPRLNDMIRCVINKSQAHALSVSSLASEIASLRNPSHSYSQLCCGHDVVRALGVALQKMLGNRNSGEVTPEIIERELRLAYQAEHFRRTRLYQSIKQWETSNSPYVILTI